MHKTKIVHNTYFLTTRLDIDVNIQCECTKHKLAVNYNCKLKKSTLISNTKYNSVD